MDVRSMNSVLAKSSPCYLETEAHKKPQLGFERILVDNSYAQFKHLKLQETGDDCVNVHPFKDEIMELSKNSKPEFDGEVKNIEDTECVWVETTSQLEELVEELSKERVIGVDTEQEGFWSFLGFTALIQISTTSKDYLVDAVALHDVMGILRPVFANPRICKVFHGAENDIPWLQRDFHIYVVNLFDTAKASEVLWKETKSLAYLLEKYCGVFKNKALQKGGDWRPRPLSAEMVRYARTDSHYLLAVANCLVSELKKDSMDSVLKAIHRSNVVCLKLYKKDNKKAYPGASIISPYLDSEGSFHYNVCENKLRCSCLSMFQSLAIRLFAWRDIMARVHDESLSFVLSNEAIGAIAATLPKFESDIYITICTADKSTSPSPVVSSHIEHLLHIIKFPDTEEDEFYHKILQRHLGSDGSCPLSIHNHNLLSDTLPKLANINKMAPKSFEQVGLCANQAIRTQAAQKRFMCKSPPYGNCRILTNDGRLLQYSSKKKMDWYLNRGLAERVEDDPLAIMLLFEHKGNNISGYKKENICVGCGKGNDYSHYAIIPRCYTKQFPEHLNAALENKVLVCVKCDGIAKSAAAKLKKQIAEEYGIPLQVKDATKTTNLDFQTSKSKPKCSEK